MKIIKKFNILSVTKIIRKNVIIKNRRLLFTASYGNEIKNAFLMTFQKFKLIKTPWLSFPSNIV